MKFLQLLTYKYQMRLRRFRVGLWSAFEEGNLAETLHELSTLSIPEETVLLTRPEASVGG